MSELSPQYTPVEIERDIYARWLEAGVFTAHAERSARVGGDRPPFTIVIPPPNVTAILHMGHGLDNVAQDVLIRWRRMAGDEALWVPGTDHAGIATQNVVERLIAKEGLTRFDLGRDAFVARVVEFVQETGGVILKQLEAIGSSCDWTRTAYTLSPELSRAVREAFVRLHEAGLIYRGHRVIHWCPRCLTSLSDEEAEPHETEGRLYHIDYVVAGAPGRTLTVATTRPETMLGDVAVAVNPGDERYRDLIGKRVILPIVNLELPVIADEYADPAFGTGVVKITPAHDANDFEVGKRHGLPAPVVIDEHATMREVSDAAGRVPLALEGLDRFDARERIVEMLRAEGRLVKVETHQHAVRRCYRCDTVVEPRLSDQWFVRMKPLAEPALAAVREGTIRIVPERWEAVYINWLENIRDWNISRQLWWGHRIPVWYCDACGGEPIVRRDAPASCPTCGGTLRQDEDVLDTWFSSWLWPISTLGWPNTDAPDFCAFYPTDVLVTGPDILFFWVARMIMAGFFFVKAPPFTTVYLHGIVRDMAHRKMSKSLGNGIDPLDVVSRYGADALRYTVIAGMGLGVDIMLDPDNLEQSFAPGRNFATKLWNIGRFLLSNVGDEDVQPLAAVDPSRLNWADTWILARLDVTIAECDAALGPARPAEGVRWSASETRQGLRLNEYAETVRRFVWDELAAWYLESTKPRMSGAADDRAVARAVLAHVFDAALRLLHPIVPFITEALWQRLPGRTPGEFLARARWPRARANAHGDASEFERIQSDAVGIRQVKADYRIPPGQRIAVHFAPGDGAEHAALRAKAEMIGHLSGSTVELTSAAPEGPGVYVGADRLFIPLAGVIDVQKECERARQELTTVEKHRAATAQRLGSESFVSRAPANVVEGARRQLEELETRSVQLRERLEALCGA